MKLLELFKGTGSVAKVFNKMYPDCEIVSVDILKKYQPTFCGDILDFDYKKYQVGHFDIIWASPECKVYSKIQHTWIGRKWDNMEQLQQVRQENSKYVKRVLEIIDYLKPTYWFIENPWDSAMKDLDFMKELPSIRFDYCRFGYMYQKPTRIWTNRKLETMKCECKEKRHKFRLGMNSKKVRGATTDKDPTNINEKYSIPPKLIEHLFSC
jgi:hypothetical protein